MEVKMEAMKLKEIESKPKVDKSLSGSSSGSSIGSQDDEVKIPSSSKVTSESVPIEPKSYSDHFQKTFNLAAPPFKPPQPRSDENPPTIEIGPSRVPVNAKIWNVVANNRVLPVLPRDYLLAPTPPMPTVPMDYRRVMIPQPPLHPYNSMRDPINNFRLYNPQPAFEEDYARNVVFNRQFGPIVRKEGFVEVRLRDNISVYISLDRTVLIDNPNSKVKIAVAGGNMLSACLDHPNGKIFQQFDRVDIKAHDGSKKLNRFVRYAKMWEKGISLTADGCALIYLVDLAGTRTTSDAITKDFRVDTSWQVFASNARIGPQYYRDAQTAMENYHFFTQDDGTQVFDIMNFRVSQTHDGMVRISRGNNRLKIHTSPTNGSATLTTPNIHCTASMGQSSHLFVRRDERRMHFDGKAFVVRNAGHSAGFDEENNLRVY